MLGQIGEGVMAKVKRGHSDHHLNRNQQSEHHGQEFSRAVNFQDKCLVMEHPGAAELNFEANSRTILSPSSNDISNLWRLEGPLVTVPPYHFMSSK